jgi:hypothetical protein
VGGIKMIPGRDQFNTNRPGPGPIIVMEGAAGLNATKIATIAWHPALSLTLKRHGDALH